ncbi:MAG: thiamine phosphate synthase [Thermodesulfobacteriota bacterium]|nr:thiamine phosphate synthase [Thermodesulfobacteriota bacterium]
MISSNQSYQEKMEIFTNEVTVYPVSCEALCRGRSDLEWLDNVLAGGARLVQLRDKISDDRALFEKALAFRARTEKAGALFIVNNRVDIALLANADGVHLGDTDLPAQEVRKIAPDLIIGVSANTKEQAATARERGASYYNIGPLFSTKTKKTISTFIGPEAIAEYSVYSDLPFTVMGGIKLHHVEELTRLNARRIAVVTALTQADDIKAETKKWIKEIKKGLRAQG